MDTPITAMVELTPAEILYILKMSGHERYVPEYGYLSPTLCHLAAKGFIEADPNAAPDEGLQVRLTRAASSNTEQFRDYERACLDAINHRDPQELYFAVTKEDIRENLFGRGFFMISEMDKKFLFWNYTNVKYIRNSLFLQAAKELEDCRELIQEFDTAYRDSPNDLCLCLGMPSLGLTEQLLSRMPDIEPHMRAARQTATYVIRSVVWDQYTPGTGLMDMPGV